MIGKKRTQYDGRPLFCIRISDFLLTKIKMVII